MTYEFLSPEWISAAREIRREVGETGPAPVRIIMNLNVTDVPFGESPLRAHMDTTQGVLALDYGHHSTPDMTITVDWATAKALLIDGKPQAAMNAFMAGKVRVEGDMSKLVALQNTAPDPGSQIVVTRLRELTT